jgi:hypothetical protein
VIKKAVRITVYLRDTQRPLSNASAILASAAGLNLAVRQPQFTILNLKQVSTAPIALSAHDEAGCPSSGNIRSGSEPNSAMRPAACEYRTDVPYYYDPPS